MRKVDNVYFPMAGVFRDGEGDKPEIKKMVLQAKKGDKLV
jgi:hypothetical protein